jgi:hypothetical protein
MHCWSGAHSQQGHAALHAPGIGARAPGRPGVAPVVPVIENYGEIFMVIFMMCDVWSLLIF